MISFLQWTSESISHLSVVILLLIIVLYEVTHISITIKHEYDYHNTTELVPTNEPAEQTSSEK